MSDRDTSLMVFSGNANPELAQKVASRLYLSLGKADVGKFSDGEVAVELNENVRGKDVFVLQSTCAPTNDNLMELIVMIDALRRASAHRITAVVPYFGYARQDRRVRSARVPISAKVVADMMVTVGVDRVLTVDLHAEQIQGFFACPVDNVYGSPVLNDDIQACDYENLMVVSPDIGGVVRARAIAKQLDDADLAYFRRIIEDKRVGQRGIAVADLDSAVRELLAGARVANTPGFILRMLEQIEAEGERIALEVTHVHQSIEGPRRVDRDRETHLSQSIDQSSSAKRILLAHHVDMVGACGKGGHTGLLNELGGRNEEALAHAL